MKITDIRADLLKSGRFIVRVYTDEGMVGMGEHGGRNSGRSVTETAALPPPAPR
jgi:L-alanine-DL-glutamate epimerase-like enolase superfamily enzyme